MSTIKNGIGGVITYSQSGYELSGRNTASQNPKEEGVTVIIEWERQLERNGPPYHTITLHALLRAYGVWGGGCCTRKTSHF